MVPSVARIRPEKPLRTSFGKKAAMVDMGVGQQHRVDLCRAKRKDPVVEFLQGFRSLKQPAVDQETS